MSFHGEMMGKVSEIIEAAGHPKLFKQHDVWGELYALQHGDRWRRDFAQFCTADLDAAGELAANLKRAAADLDSHNAGTLDAITDAAQGWAGSAAGAFKQYMYRVKDASEFQIDALKALAVVAEGQYKLIEAIRKDLRALADQAIFRLNLNADSGNNNVGVVLAITGAVVAVATAGSGGVVVAAVVLGAFSVGAEVHAALTISGDSQVDRLRSMDKALDEFAERVEFEQSRLDRGLQELQSFFMERADVIRPPRPRLSGDFHRR